MRRRLLPTLLCALVLLAPRALSAQGRPAPLEGFVASVARLWQAGDAAAISELAPEDGGIVLDLGTGPAEGGEAGRFLPAGGRGRAGGVEPRHAAAALRDLFRGRASLSVRAAQVTLAG